MVLNSTQFEIVCFFSLGFLCLVGFIGFYLSILFKSKIYYYYCGYVLSNLAFIACVYCEATHLIPVPSADNDILRLTIDITQMIGYFLFGAFIYHALVHEDSKFKKLHFVFKIYAGFTLFYTLILVLFPRFVLDSIVYFIITRLILVVLSLVFYYYIIKELKKIYFRYLFLAITFLLLSGFFAFRDSIINYYSNEYLGFQYLCMGYIFENVCFSCAYIYKYFSTYLQKKDAEIKHKLQLSVVQLEMKQQTMHHIGREIHDNVGQKLTLASLYTQQLAFENKIPEVNESIENISQIINESLAELRELSKSLTDDSVYKTSVYNLIKNEVKKVQKTRKCDISFYSVDPKLELDYQQKSILIRICQEFIQNSLKYAQCKTIRLELKQKDNELLFELRDDGIGFDTNKKTTGIGLENIKKRTKILNGTYDLSSNESTGTRLLISIPLHSNLHI